MSMTAEDERLAQRDLLTVGITYRQLDYWCSAGWLRADATHPGSGNRRSFPPSERQIARLMLLLIEAGVDPPSAARAARHGVEHGLPYGLLNDTVAVMWVDDGSPIRKQAPVVAAEDSAPSEADVATAYAGLERLWETTLGPDDLT